MFKIIRLFILAVLLWTGVVAADDHGSCWSDNHIQVCYGKYATQIQKARKLPLEEQVAVAHDIAREATLDNPAIPTDQGFAILVPLRTHILEKIKSQSLTLGNGTPPREEEHRWRVMGANPVNGYLARKVRGKTPEQKLAIVYEHVGTLLNNMGVDPVQEPFVRDQITANLRYQIGISTPEEDNDAESASIEARMKGLVESHHFNAGDRFEVMTYGNGKTVHNVVADWRTGPERATVFKLHDGRKVVWFGACGNFGLLTPPPKIEEPPAPQPPTTTPGQPVVVPEGEVAKRLNIELNAGAFAGGAIGSHGHADWYGAEGLVYVPIESLIGVEEAQVSVGAGAFYSADGWYSKGSAFKGEGERIFYEGSLKGNYLDEDGTPHWYRVALGIGKDWLRARNPDVDFRLDQSQYAMRVLGEYQTRDGDIVHGPSIEAILGLGGGRTRSSLVGYKGEDISRLHVGYSAQYPVTDHLILRGTVGGSLNKLYTDPMAAGDAGVGLCYMDNWDEWEKFASVCAGVGVGIGKGGPLPNVIGSVFVGAIVDEWFRAQQANGVVATHRSASAGTAMTQQGNTTSVAPKQQVPGVQRDSTTTVSNTTNPATVEGSQTGESIDKKQPRVMDPMMLYGQ